MTVASHLHPAMPDAYAAGYRAACCPMAFAVAPIGPDEAAWLDGFLDAMADRARPAPTVEAEVVAVTERAR